MSHSIYRVSSQRSPKVNDAAVSSRLWFERTQHCLFLAFAALAALAMVMVSAVRADESLPTHVPTATIEQMKSVITAQIDAFLAEDAEAAYAFASEPIKRRFSTPNRFVSMVQRGYPVVYSPQSFSFGGSALTARGPAQQVRFIDEDGLIWRGLFTFAETDDGGLLISGVFLRRENERQI